MAFALSAVLYQFAHSQLNFKDGSLQPLPQFVDFELFDGVNLSEVYPGWQEGVGYLQPQFAGGAWFRGNVLHGSNTASVIFSTIGNKDEWIISPQFLVTDSTQLSFKAALSRFWDDPVSGNLAITDSISVLVSTNIDNFDFEHLIYSFKVHNQPGWQLESYSFDISQFSGQLIHLAFYATNGQDPNSTAAFHLDDIEIKNAVPRDAMPVALVSPTPNACINEDTPVIVSVRNDGLESFSALPIRVRVRGEESFNIFSVYEGALAPGEEAIVNLGKMREMPYGEYSFTVSTELPGDAYNINDVLPPVSVSYPEPRELPLPFMNFMGFYSANLGELYPGWYEARGKGRPLVAMNTDWQGENHQGVRAASVFFSGLGTEDWMVGPKFTATENLVVELKVAAQFGMGGDLMGSDDKLAIMVSADCGTTWEEAGAITAASTISSHFQDFIFEIGDYDGQEIILAFYATTGFVSDPQQYVLYITDVSIKNFFDLDAGVSRLLSPGNLCGFSEQEEVTVEVTNFGAQTISDFQVAYHLSGDDPVMETITQSIHYGESLVYTFNATVDLLNADESILSVYTILDGDQNPENDGLFDQVIQLSSFDLSMDGMYSMSFEEDEDSSAWLVEDGNNDGTTWELLNDPAHARTGSYSYAYFSNQTSTTSNDWLFSPCFFLEEGYTYVVNFYYRNRATNFPEELKLHLGQEQSGASMDIILLDLGAIANSTYQLASVEFSVDQSGEYYFGWHAYGPADQFGMHLDDISVYQLFDQDLAIVNAVAPRYTSDNCTLDDVNTFEVHVLNLGTDDISGIEIGVIVDSEPITTFSFTETIAAGNDLWLTLQNGLSLNPEQYYDLKIFIMNSEDQNSANDTIFLQHFIHSNYHMGFEQYQDFESWTIENLAGINQWEIIESTDLSNSGNQTLGIRTDGGGGNTDNNDWAITGCFELKADRCYEISFYYRSRFSTENLAVYMGNDNTPAALTDQLINLPSFSSNAYLFTSQQFTVDEDGVYYFGWHTTGGTSGRYWIYVDDIRIIEDVEDQPFANPVITVLDTEAQFEANAGNFSFLEWDFGDGNKSNDAQAFHIYELPGTYDVTLTLGSGCVDVTYNLSVTLDCLMEPDFTFVINETTVTFEASGNAEGYEWHFGDGNIAAGAIASHNYFNTEPATFDVTLTAFYDCGFTSVEKQVFVEDVYTEPVSYMLTLLANPAEGGFVSGGGEFDPGEEILVAAVAAEGFDFVNWTNEANDIVSAQTAFLYTMPEVDVTLTANFVDEIIQPELFNVAIVNEYDFAQTSGEGDYEAGETVTVEVVYDGPAIGVFFIGWYENEQLLSEDLVYEFEMPERDVNLVVVFSPTPFVGNIDELSLMVFPNPARGSVSISSDLMVERVVVIDVQGVTVIDDAFPAANEVKLDVSNLDSGNYFLRLYAGEHVITRTLQLITQ